jgi:hypothetical protein
MLNREKEANMNEELVSGRRQSRDGNNWVNIVLGIWVIISPFVLAMHSPKVMWNNVITGAVVCILALIRWGTHRLGLSWLNLILGICLVISPFVLFLNTAVMWNNVILGIIIAASALSHTYSKASAQT